MFESFQRHNVRYLVIGGIAAVLYGVPRATFDLDILIEVTTDNARRLLAAPAEAQFGTASLVTAEELLANELTVFKHRVRIDVQTSIPGLTFNEAWPRKATMNYQGQSFYVVSRRDLITSKLAAGREKDLDDSRMLNVAQEENES